MYAPLSLEELPENLLSILPTSKMDYRAAVKVHEMGYPAIKSIIPHLLSWYQDINWPMAGDLLPFLRKIRGHMTEEIREILKGDDMFFISGILVSFFADSASADFAGTFKKELLHLAGLDDTDGVHEEAREILEGL